MNIVQIAHEILLLEGIKTCEIDEEYVEEKFIEQFGLRLDELEYLIELYERTKSDNERNN